MLYVVCCGVSVVCCGVSVVCCGDSLCCSVSVVCCGVSVVCCGVSVVCCVLCELGTSPRGVMIILRLITILEFTAVTSVMSMCYINGL